MSSHNKASFTKRKSNFTFTETDVLLTEIETNRELLLSPPGVANNKQYKRHVWENITTQINSIGEGDERTMEEVRKKWSDMMHLVKRKCSKGKQDLNDIELRVMALKCESDVWSLAQADLNSGGGGAVSVVKSDPETTTSSRSSVSGGEIQIKQEKMDEEYDHPQVYFNGVRPESPEKSNHIENDHDDDDIDDVTDDDVDDDYPETTIAYDSSSRKRKSNFSMGERSAMVSGVRKRQAVILSKSNDVCTHEKKRLAWDCITGDINRAGKGDYRTVEEVRKKWNDMQSLARRKRRRRMEMALLEAVSGTESGRGDAEVEPDMEQDVEASVDCLAEIEDDCGSSSMDHSDFIERVMASNYKEVTGKDEKEFLDDEEEDGDDNNGDNNDSDSNCSEWTPGSKRKSRAASSVKFKTSRKGNFSTSEMNILLDEIYRRRKVLFSPNLDRRTGERKRSAWSKIAKYVSTACTKEQRTLLEVRKKWSDLFTRASKYRVKLEQEEGEEKGDEKLTDIDKVNERVLYIYDQRDEIVRHANEEFIKNVLEDDDSPEQRITGDHGNVDHPPDTIETPGDQDGRIIEMDYEDWDDENVAGGPCHSFLTEESPLVIENVSTIDERVFSSMGSHPTSSENSLDLHDDEIQEEPHGEEIGEREHFVFRKRKGKFSSGETSILLGLMESHRKSLLNKTMSGESKSRKKEIWQEITEKINMIKKGVPRNVDEVKKKWYDLQCNARKKQALQQSLCEEITQSYKKLTHSNVLKKQVSIVDCIKSADNMLSILTPAARAIVAKSKESRQEDNGVVATNGGPTEPVSIKDDEITLCNDVASKSSISISTDRIRDNVAMSANIMTSTDWKVLEIAQGKISQLASYAAMDHNYDKLQKKARCGVTMEINVLPSREAIHMKSAAQSNDDVKQSPPLHAASDSVDQLRLKIERKRLVVERKRLVVEQEKLRLLRRLVQLEERRRSLAEEGRSSVEAGRSDEDGRRSHEEGGRSLAVEYLQYD